MKEIPYNFMVGDDGIIYEGRGFRFQGEIPANETDSATSFNEAGLIFAFIGTFNTTDAYSERAIIQAKSNSTNMPSDLQIRMFNEFVSQSVRRGMIIRNFKILLQDQLVSSSNVSVGLLRAFENRAEYHKSNYY